MQEEFVKQNNQQNETTQQTNGNNWLQAENQEVQQNKMSGEILPSLKLEEGKITLFTVDFSKPFEKWIDSSNNAVKKIIPVMHEGVRKNLWLNVKNPLYRELIEAGTKGQTTFKVMRTGQANQTRYSLVKE